MLSDRPLVVRDSSIVEIHLIGETDSVYLTLDGQLGMPLHATDTVRVLRAKDELQLIQPPTKPYFEILRNKLKWGEA
jgi:NAD+ kinase